jgi:hypothetical protein
MIWRARFTRRRREIVLLTVLDRGDDPRAGIGERRELRFEIPGTESRCSGCKRAPRGVVRDRHDRDDAAVRVVAIQAGADAPCPLDRGAVISGE